MSQLTTHVLDASTGNPATGVTVKLLKDDVVIASGTTDADGRVAELGPGRLEAGIYRLHFAVDEYFKRSGRETFYPGVSIDFWVVDSERRYHVPLLISPFAYSTYRGS
jgi:5-hydroxyisourate hydrolase